MIAKKLVSAACVGLCAHAQTLNPSAIDSTSINLIIFDCSCIMLYPALLNQIQPACHSRRSSFECCNHSAQPS